MPLSAPVGPGSKPQAVWSASWQRGRVASNSSYQPQLQLPCRGILPRLERGVSTNGDRRTNHRRSRSTKCWGSTVVGTSWTCSRRARLRTDASQRSSGVPETQSWRRPECATFTAANQAPGVRHFPLLAFGCFTSAHVASGPFAVHKAPEAAWIRIAEFFGEDGFGDVLVAEGPDEAKE